MHIHKVLRGFAALVIVGCSQDGGAPGRLDGQAHGAALLPGEVRRITLPPSQYQRLHFKAEAGGRLEVTAAGGAAPLSLSLYPVVLQGQSGSYTRPSSDFVPRPFQKTGVPPLSTTIQLPDNWKANDAVVVELKNLGAAISDLEVRIRRGSTGS
jgi:hypothetical protein